MRVPPVPPKRIVVPVVIYHAVATKELLVARVFLSVRLFAAMAARTFLIDEPETYLYPTRRNFSKKLRNINIFHENFFFFFCK